MPEAFGYGGDEVKATTHNKTVKKATSQLDEEGKLIKRGIGTDTPQQQQFRKEVQATVSDPSTRQDVLKAAGMTALPGAGISSTPPAKKTVTRRPMGAKYGVPGVHPGIKKTPMEKDEIARGAKPSHLATSREAMKRYKDVLLGAGVAPNRVQQYMDAKFGEAAYTTRRAERRETFLRRKAAEKYGTPP